MKHSNVVYTRSPMQVMPSSVASSSPVCRSNTANIGQQDNGVGYSKKQSLINKSDVLKPMTDMILHDGYIAMRSSLKSSPDHQADSVTGNIQAISILKPIVTNVKLLSQGAGLPKQNKLCFSKSTDALDHIELLKTGDEDKKVEQMSPRSSFMDPNGPPTRCSVYIELGEYQTLLKHSGNNEERIYSLPQPQCYGENTLKSIKLITEKYDTFKRRQLRAHSFRDEVVLCRDTDKASLLMTSSEMGQRSPHRTIYRDVAIAEEEGMDNCCSIECSNLEKSSVANIDGDKTIDQLDADVKALKEEELRSALLRNYCNASVDTKQSYDESELSLLERLKIEMFYRSRGTFVFVCCSLADVFIGTYSDNDSARHWIHIHTGVPVWLLNSGTSVRPRELILIIADRLTGFPLWQDSINYLSNYHQLSVSTHALRVSGSLSKIVKLNIFCTNAAEEFLESYRSILIDPNDSIWKISKKNSKRVANEESQTNCLNLKRKQHTKINKSSISQPCNFVHVSHVDPKEANFRAAFVDLLPLTQSNNSQLEMHSDFNDCVLGNQQNEFRPRLPTS